GKGVLAERRRESHQLPGLRRVDLDEVGGRGQGQPEALALRVERDAHPGGPGPGDQVAVAVVRRPSWKRAGDRQPPPPSQQPPDGLDELGPCTPWNGVAVFVELRQPAARPLGHGQRRTTLAGRPDERPVDPLRAERLDEPRARMAAEDASGPNLRPDRPGRSGNVQALAPRGLDEPGRTMDRARDEAIHLEELVDRGIRCDADDHRLTIARPPGGTEAQAAATDPVLAFVPWPGRPSSAPGASSSPGASS